MLNAYMVTYHVGLGTGTVVCTGSTNLLKYLASIFASDVILRTSKKHAIFQYGDPLDVFRAERGETVYHTAAIRSTDGF